MAVNSFTHEPTDKETLERIRALIPGYISEKRLKHTLLVEKEAINISKIMFPFLGIDEKYIYDISAAALLHDITKMYSIEKHTEICKKENIPADKYALSRGFTLHAKTGAFVAKKDFCINDTVFSSIYCHTTGKEDMNIFEKIIFIADYIEETRSAKECVSARNYFYGNIEKAENKMLILDMTIIKALKSTVSYLLECNSPIECETINTLNYLLAEYALQGSIQR